MGLEVVELFNTNKFIRDLVIDETAEKIYLIDDSGEIKQSNLDGTQLETIAFNGQVSPLVPCHRTANCHPFGTIHFAY